MVYGLSNKKSLILDNYDQDINKIPAEYKGLFDTVKGMTSDSSLDLDELSNNWEQIEPFFGPHGSIIKIFEKKQGSVHFTKSFDDLLRAKKCYTTRGNIHPLAIKVIKNAISKKIKKKVSGPGSAKAAELVSNVSIDFIEFIYYRNRLRKEYVSEIKTYFVDVFRGRYDHMKVEDLLENPATVDDFVNDAKPIVNKLPSRKGDFANFWKLMEDNNFNVRAVVTQLKQNSVLMNFIGENNGNIRDIMTRSERMGILKLDDSRYNAVMAVLANYDKDASTVPGNNVKPDQGGVGQSGGAGVAPAVTPPGSSGPGNSPENGKPNNKPRSPAGGASVPERVEQNNGNPGSLDMGMIGQYQTDIDGTSAHIGPVDSDPLVQDEYLHYNSDKVPSEWFESLGNLSEETKNLIRSVNYFSMLGAHFMTELSRNSGYENEGDGLFEDAQNFAGYAGRLYNEDVTYMGAFGNNIAKGYQRNFEIIYRLVSARSDADASKYEEDLKKNLNSMIDDMKRSIYVGERNPFKMVGDRDTVDEEKMQEIRGSLDSLSAKLMSNSPDEEKKYAMLKFFTEQLNSEDYLNLEVMKMIEFDNVDNQFNKILTTEQNDDNINNYFIGTIKTVTIQGKQFGLSRNYAEFIKKTRKERTEVKYIVMNLKMEIMKDLKKQVKSAFANDKIIDLYYENTTYLDDLKDNYGKYIAKGSLMAAGAIATGGLARGAAKVIGTRLGIGAIGQTVLGGVFATGAFGAGMPILSGTINGMSWEDIMKKVKDPYNYLHTAAFIGALEVVNGLLGVIGVGAGEGVANSVVRVGADTAALLGVDYFMFDGSFSPEEVINALIFAIMMSGLHNKASNSEDTLLKRIKIDKDAQGKLRVRIEKVRKSEVDLKYNEEMKVEAERWENEVQAKRDQSSALNTEIADLHRITIKTEAEIATEIRTARNRDGSGNITVTGEYRRFEAEYKTKENDGVLRGLNEAARDVELDALDSEKAKEFRDEAVAAETAKTTEKADIDAEIISYGADPTPTAITARASTINLDSDGIPTGRGVTEAYKEKFRELKERNDKAEDGFDYNREVQALKEELAEKMLKAEYEVKRGAKTSTDYETEATRIKTEFENKRKEVFNMENKKLGKISGKIQEYFKTRFEDMTDGQHIDVGKARVKKAGDQFEILKLDESSRELPSTLRRVNLEQLTSALKDLNVSRSDIAKEFFKNSDNTFRKVIPNLEFKVDGKNYRIEITESGDIKLFLDGGKKGLSIVEGKFKTDILDTIYLEYGEGIIKVAADTMKITKYERDPDDLPENPPETPAEKEALWKKLFGKSFKASINDIKETKGIGSKLWKGTRLALTGTTEWRTFGDGINSMLIVTTATGPLLGPILAAIVNGDFEKLKDTDWEYICANYMFFGVLNGWLEAFYGLYLLGDSAMKIDKDHRYVGNTLPAWSEELKKRVSIDGIIKLYEMTLQAFGLKVSEEKKQGVFEEIERLKKEKQGYAAGSAVTK